MQSRTGWPSGGKRDLSASTFVLQPFINLDRDITFARSYNTLGEDPFLSGVLGAAEVRGEQAQGVMSMAKHFVAYDSDSYDVFVDQQTLHEVLRRPV